MKAILIRDQGQLAWEEVPEPSAGENEVVLRVHATGVNRADLLQRQGRYPSPPGAPPWMGLEAAGTIEQVGAGVRCWNPGDAACCLLAGGGYAEKVVVPTGQLLPVPRGLSFEQAAALPEAFATAWLNLVGDAQLAPGETVLVHAGASGVGTAAIQLAHDRGARVVTTVGSEQKAARVRELGADIVILYREENVTERLRGIPGGIDVVLDCLGGEDLGAQLPILNLGGRWIVIAYMKGRAVRMDLAPFLSKRLRLIGSTLRSRPVEEKARILAGLRREVWPRIEAGAIVPVIHEILSITEADRAHAVLDANLNIGKVVLRVPQE